MVVAAFSTTVLCSQQRVTIQTLTECARHCGQMSILNFTWVFTMFLFLLVTREILDFVCFQILQAYYLMIQSFDAVLLNGMQTRWLAPDHFFFTAAHPLQNRLGELWNHFGHTPGAKRTAGEPKITVPVPVLALSTSDLGTQQW